jgi:hypothetical protein
MSGPHAQEISLRAPAGSATRVTPSGRLARALREARRAAAAGRRRPTTAGRRGRGLVHALDLPGRGATGIGCQIHPVDPVTARKR